VRLTPRWRLVVGHGEDSAHETSLTMSPTYGVPTVPGSALKGVAASQARCLHGKRLPPEVVRLFGTPRPEVDADAARGSVAVLDALPVEKPQVVVDVLTPHVKPYYDKDSAGRPKEPPAEYHSPVPVHFLAVAGGTFQAWLIGPPADVQRFAELLHDGADDLGVGGKTAAGYGYCKVEVQP
jgi:CRISPR/Cas system CMR subunit Cmr6 (Cas7 group RAMP superfamily)